MKQIDVIKNLQLEARKEGNQIKASLYTRILAAIDTKRIDINDDEAVQLEIKREVKSLRSANDTLKGLQVDATDNDFDRLEDSYKLNIEGIKMLEALLPTVLTKDEIKEKLSSINLKGLTIPAAKDLAIATLGTSSYEIGDMMQVILPLVKGK